MNENEQIEGARTVDVERAAFEKWCDNWVAEPPMDSLRVYNRASMWEAWKGALALPRFEVPVVVPAVSGGTDKHFPLDAPPMNENIRGLPDVVDE